MDHILYRSTVILLSQIMSGVKQNDMTRKYCSFTIQFKSIWFV